MKKGVFYGDTPVLKPIHLYFLPQLSVSKKETMKKPAVNNKILHSKNH